MDEDGVVSAIGDADPCCSGGSLGRSSRFLLTTTLGDHFKEGLLAVHTIGVELSPQVLGLGLHVEWVASG